MEYQVILDKKTGEPVDVYQEKSEEKALQKLIFHIGSGASNEVRNDFEKRMSWRSNALDVKRWTGKENPTYIEAINATAVFVAKEHYRVVSITKADLE